jgi:hypothetical protein
MGHKKHKRLQPPKPTAHVAVAVTPPKASIELAAPNDTGCLKLLGIFFFCWVLIGIGSALITHGRAAIYTSQTFVTGIEKFDDVTIYYYGENRSISTTNDLDVNVGDDIMIDYKWGLLGEIEIVNVREGILCGKCL